MSDEANTSSAESGKEGQGEGQSSTEDNNNPTSSSSANNHNPSPATTASAASSTTTGSSSSNKSSKKRNLSTFTGTPAPLQSSLQAIHTTLATTYPFISTASLPAFQSLIHSYLTSKSNNIPTIIQQNLPNQISTLAQKNINDVPPYVHLSVRDAAPQLNIGEKKLTVKGGMRGYRMVRASQGVDAGCWYYEALVLDPPKVKQVVEALPTNVRLGEGVREGLKRGLEMEMKRESGGNGNGNGNGGGSSGGPSNAKKRKTDMKKHSNSNGVEQYSVGGHLRMGWSMRTGELQAPVGYDRWSYGIRDIHGSKIHHSKREDKWGGMGFQPGDVVGFAICLVDKDTNETKHEYGDDGGGGGGPSSFSSGGTSGSFKSRNACVVQSNHIRFFKNGAPMGDFIVSRGVKSGGEAFDNIQSGTYYPAISSYMGGTAQVNFGPHFICPPKGLPTGMKLRPMSDICVKPMEPDQVLKTFHKEKFLGKKVGEEIAKAINDAVFTEATLRFEAYQKHLNDNVEVVRKARNDRGMGTSDLPEPVVETNVEEETKPADEGKDAGGDSGEPSVRKDEANTRKGDNKTEQPVAMDVE